MASERYAIEQVARRQLIGRFSSWDACELSVDLRAVLPRSTRILGQGMNVCVVALGKIGLPLAVQIARSGHSVIGADVSASTVDMVNRGEAPFMGEAHLAEWLSEVVANGSLSATTETTTAVRSSDVVVVVVPLIVDETAAPDYRALDAATDAIAAGLQPGTLVSYETTLPVGSTRNRFAVALAEASGLELETELFVCHSPERVYSGRIFDDLARYPKLIGGLGDASTKRCLDFYESALQFHDRNDLDDIGRPNGVWDLGSAEAAELAKLAETTYRDVNIGFANQLARYADTIGVDIYGVIDACNSQPFSHIHRPGIAVGGHCIPVYPRFYLHNDPIATIPAAARTANDAMPAYAVDLLATSLGSLRGRTIAVLGIAYRGGVKETAFSGVFGTVEALRAAGANVVVSDPMYSDEEVRDLGFAPHEVGQTIDGAILQTDHAAYRDLDPNDLPGAVCLVDGRNWTSAAAFAGSAVKRVVIGA